MQGGDVGTFSDVTELENITQFKPNIELQVGINNFVFWYKNYHMGI